MAKIFKLRKNDSGSMQDFMDMSLNDPRRIAPTIAISNPQLLLNWLQLKEVGLIMCPIIIFENLLNNPPRPVKDIDVNLVFQYVHCKCGSLAANFEATVTFGPG